MNAGKRSTLSSNRIHRNFRKFVQWFQQAMSQPIKIDIARKSMSLTNQNQFRVFKNEVVFLETMSLAFENDIVSH